MEIYVKYKKNIILLCKNCFEIPFVILWKSLRYVENKIILKANNLKNISIYLQHLLTTANISKFSIYLQLVMQVECIK